MDSTSVTNLVTFHFQHLILTAHFMGTQCFHLHSSVLITQSYMHRYTQCIIKKHAFQRWSEMKEVLYSIPYRDHFLSNSRPLKLHLQVPPVKWGVSLDLVLGNGTQLSIRMEQPVSLLETLKMYIWNVKQSGTRIHVRTNAPKVAEALPEWVKDTLVSRN